MVYLSEKLAGYEDVYLVPAGISMDSEYNYDSAEQTVNPYSESTEIYEYDPVHPNNGARIFCGTRN